MLWPFLPQTVFTETLLIPINVNQVGQQSAVFGQAGGRAGTRTFQLQYDLVDSATCFQMADFYRAVRGPALAFDFVNPNDGKAYQVRFDDRMRIELFTPIFFRTNPLPFVVVTS